MHTPEQAKDLWCPMVRWTGISGASVNVDGRCRAEQLQTEDQMSVVIARLKAAKEEARAALAAGADAQQDERAAFEAFALNCPMGRFDITRKGEGYWSSHTHLMWDAWQARAALSAAAKPVEPEGPYFIGACITEGLLHATVMRRDASGSIHVLACAEMDAESLKGSDCIAQMTAPGAEQAKPVEAMSHDEVMGFVLKYGRTSEVVRAVERHLAAAWGVKLEGITKEGA